MTARQWSGADDIKAERLRRLTQRAHRTGELALGMGNVFAHSESVAIVVLCCAGSVGASDQTATRVNRLHVSGKAPLATVGHSASVAAPAVSARQSHSKTAGMGPEL